jgi:WD40 repeat protein
VAVSGGYDATVRVWDLALGIPADEPLTDHQVAVNAGAVTAVAVGELEGRPVVVCGGGDGTLRLWDLERGTPIGPRLTGHDVVPRLRPFQREVTAVAVGELEGRPVVVSGGYDGRLRVWDLAHGTSIGQWSTSQDVVHPFKYRLGGVDAVAVGKLEGRPVVTSLDYFAVRVWDLADGTPIGKLTGPWGSVHAVALGELEGRPVVVCGGVDGTVRVWDLERGTLGEPLTGHKGPVKAVAIGELEGRPVVVSGDDEGTLCVRQGVGRLPEMIEIGSGINAIALIPENDCCVLGCTMGVMSLGLKLSQP